MSVSASRPTPSTWRGWFPLGVHLAALQPLASLIFAWLRDDLTVNPIQDLTVRTGKAALILLAATLACTPLDRWLKFHPILKARRTLGLYTFLYAALHMLIFVGLDFGFDLGLIWQGAVEKKYVSVGFAAFLILLALALTSFDWWKKHLGKNWKRLHRLVYLAGILAVVHYVWLVKSDIRQPLAFGALIGLLLLARLRPIKQALARWQMKLERRSAGG